MTSLHGARPQLIRSLNEQLMLDLVRQSGPIARADLVRLSGLSKPTVALALTNLERDALVEVTGRMTGSRGRTAALYELRREAGFVLGLDVGREYFRGRSPISAARSAPSSTRGHARQERRDE